jgi:hypothetical protein
MMLWKSLDTIFSEVYQFYIYEVMAFSAYFGPHMV